jgi:hypothetical protein
MRKVKVLVFEADPASAPPHGRERRLLLDEESRLRREKVRAADFGDALEFDVWPAARPDDLIQGLNEVHPQVVHFSGHGAEGGLVLSGSDRKPYLVDTEALRHLFHAFREGIRLVVLNACCTAEQARAAADAVGCAVGTPSTISDAASITFSASFYRAIAFGRSVQEAFDQARASLVMQRTRESEYPVLVSRADVDPSALVLVQPDGGANGTDGGMGGHGPGYLAVHAPAAHHGVPTCRLPNAEKLFGRAGDVARFATLLTEGGGPAPALSIRGLPGAGKTDFVRAVGCDPRVVEHFAGGVLYAELGRAADAVELLARWCDGLGVKRPKSEVPADFADLVRARLAGRPALLVLDDVWETTIAQAHALADCRAAGCALLVSTRNPEIADELAGSPGRSHRLDVLGDEPAVSLLREHAPDAVAVDPGGAAELAASLGNLPLALKLAGRLVQRDDSAAPCRALLGSWRVRLKEMKGHERRPGMGAGDVSLDAIISLSYDAMPDDATRAAAASLSVLGPAPLEFDRDDIDAAWRVALRMIPAFPAPAGPAAKVEAWITAFVASGLLERNAGTRRYGLHQTVHAFLEDRCRAWKISSA